MAVLTIDPKSGKLHADEIGQRSTKSGALWGTAIGAAAGILSAGILLVPGMIVGATAGAGLGALNHKSVGMSDADKAKLVDNLKMGGAALAVMADDFEVEPVKAKMVDEGGAVEYFKVDEAVAEELTVAAAAQEAATEAIEDAVEDAADAVESAAEAAGDALDALDDTGKAAVTKLMAVTGMGAAEAVQLYDAGVVRASNLLQQAATPEGRAALAEASGVDEEVILAEAKKMDLMRIKGVGYKYADLLLASGVDTVPELATRNAANLSKKMGEVNAVEGIVDSLPTEEHVADWVAQAKDLPRMIYY
jgi:predicted flap endonuclease-1-like 5' DNA nuclease